MATVALVLLAGSLRSPSGSLLARGQPAPSITGTTLDGQPFDLKSLRGHPVVVNFWDAGCVPCREEFPLLIERLAAHADDGLAVVGVLFVDQPGPARDFVAQYGATWPTVQDPSGVIRTAYRVAVRPYSFFVDRQGILRSIQVGQLADDCEFERQYALISGATGITPPQSAIPCSTLGGGQPSPSIEVPPEQ